MPAFGMSSTLTFPACQWRESKGGLRFTKTRVSSGKTFTHDETLIS